MANGRALNNTAIVVLGMVATGRRNGHEISRTVGLSTRFFWPASVGGIYPELRRLEEAGLLQAEDDPRGEATRHSYALTSAGRVALREWLLNESLGHFEMRNEDLLRLFLAAELGPDEHLAILRKIRAGHEAQVEQLESVAQPVAEKDPAAHRMLVLDYGIALHRSAAEWCRQAEKRLDERE